MKWLWTTAAVLALAAGMAPLQVRNLGTGPLYRSLAVTGIPAEPPAAEARGFTLSRRLMTPDGAPADPLGLRQNDQVVVLIEGKVESAAGGVLRMRSTATGAAIAVNHEGATEPGATVWFAIRPEKVSVSLDKPAQAETNAIQGVVNDIGYLGDISVYHVRLPAGGNVKATVTNMTRLVERPITWEDKVWLSWTADAGVVLTG